MQHYNISLTRDAKYEEADEVKRFKAQLALENYGPLKQADGKLKERRNMVNRAPNKRVKSDDMR